MKETKKGIIISILTLKKKIFLINIKYLNLILKMQKKHVFNTAIVCNKVLLSSYLRCAKCHPITVTRLSP